jgi:hypothetical protein
LVGVSGGRDSVALLHWLQAHGYRKLVVCHLEHGLRGRAGKADARFVARLAQTDGLKFELGSAEIPALAKRRKQSIKLMAALGAVVASLDRLARILPAIRQLGRQHAAYGVRPDHYATVGEALIWTLQQAQGADFTPALRRAWTDAYGRLAWAMIAAAEEDETLAEAA